MKPRECNVNLASKSCRQVYSRPKLVLLDVTNPLGASSPTQLCMYTEHKNTLDPRVKSTDCPDGKGGIDPAEHHSETDKQVGIVEGREGRRKDTEEDIRQLQLGRRPKV